VLYDVNISVGEGEVALIHGKSGAGKSVLLSLIAGLDKPTSGEIYFENHPLNILSNKNFTQLRKHKIGIIFQNFNLISYWTALENVLAAVNRPVNSSETETAKSLLNILGLGNSMNNYPRELSMGEQQRTAIARALIKKPKLIIADEPTGEVDKETGELIIEMMFDGIVSNKTAIVIASHGHFPACKADKVYELNNGIIL
jgi:putative ABC transport system ATP-binding protein